jgi:hypothetical protein
MTHAQIQFPLSADRAAGVVVRVAGIPFGMSDAVLTVLTPTCRGKLR